MWSNKSRCRFPLFLGFVSSLQTGHLNAFVLVSLLSIWPSSAHPFLLASQLSKFILDVFLLCLATVFCLPKKKPFTCPLTLVGQMKGFFFNTGIPGVPRVLGPVSELWDGSLNSGVGTPEFWGTSDAFCVKSAWQWSRKLKNCIFSRIVQEFCFKSL